MYKIEGGREGVRAILNELRIANFPKLLMSSLIGYKLILEICVSRLNRYSLDYIREIHDAIIGSINRPEAGEDAKSLCKVLLQKYKCFFTRTGIFMYFLIEYRIYINLM